MKKATACTIYFEARSLETGNPYAGLTVTGSLYVPGSDTPTEITCVEVGNGLYKFDLTESQTNYDSVAVKLSTTTESVFLPLISIDFDTDHTATLDGLETQITDLAEDVANLPDGDNIASSVWLKNIGGSYTAGAAARYLKAIETTPQSVWEYTTRSLSSLTVGSYGNLLTMLSAPVALADSFAEVASKDTGETIISMLNEIDAKALQIKVDTDRIPVSPATASSVSTLRSDVKTLASEVAKIFSVAANWNLTGDTLTARDAAGDALATFTVTRNDDGDIVDVLPN